MWRAHNCGDMTDRNSPPLKILVIATLFPTPEDPAFGVFVARRLSAIHALAGDRVAFRIISPKPWFPLKQGIWGRYGANARLPKQAAVEGFEVRFPRYFMVPKLGWRQQARAVAGAVRREMRMLAAEGFEPDLIDAHYLYPDGVAAQQIARELQLPYLQTARGSDVTEIMLDQRIKPVMISAAREAAMTLTVSESLRQAVVDYGVPSDIVQTARNGVDLDIFQPQAGAGAYTIPPHANTPVYLGVGSLIPRKRMDLILDAFSRLADGTLLLAGEGPERTRLEAQVTKLGLQSRVHFLGAVAPSDMPVLMGSADVFVLASDREGWPNVVLESLSCGTPVATVDVGGVSEFVTADGGLIVPQNDPGALSAAMAALSQSRRNRERVAASVAHLGWHETASKIWDLYTRLANKDVCSAK